MLRPDSSIQGRSDKARDRESEETYRVLKEENAQIRGNSTVASGRVHTFFFSVSGNSGGHRDPPYGFSPSNIAIPINF